MSAGAAVGGVAVVSASSTPSSVVLSNLGYLIGLVVLVVVVVSIVVLRHHRSTSTTTEEDMNSFHRGLAALAPERTSIRHRPGTLAPPSPSLSPRSHIRGVPIGADGATPREPSTGSEAG